MSAPGDEIRLHPIGVTIAHRIPETTSHALHHRGAAFTDFEDRLAVAAHPSHHLSREERPRVCVKRFLEHVLEILGSALLQRRLT